MRQIKFRAWDKNKKAFVDNVCLTGQSVFMARTSPEFNELVDKWYREKGDILGGNYAEIDYTDWYAFEDIEVSFFTGFTDVEHKDIYEGDFDEAGNVVEFSNGCWNLNGDRPLSTFHPLFKISGNIFENPNSTTERAATRPLI
jgi:hypothetical protein